MRIPTYERQIGREVPGPLRAPAATVTDYEGAALQNLGRTLGGAADEALKVALDIQQKADDAAVLEAANRWDESTTKYLNDPETGLFNRRGKGAKGMSGEAHEWFGKLEKDITRELENDNQRSLFSKYILRNRGSKIESISRHERTEFQRYRVEVTEGAVKTALSTIAANYTDDGIFEASLAQAENALLTLLADQGEEIVTEKIKELRSQAHIARLAQFLEADPRTAEAYFKANRDAIDGAQHAKLKGAIDKQVQIIWTQETADAIMGRFSSESAALRHIRDKYEGEKENALITAVKTRFSEKRTARAEAKAAMEERYWDLVEGAESLTELQAALLKGGYSTEKVRKGLRYFQGARGQDFHLEADYADSEEKILDLGQKYGVPEGTVRRAVLAYRSVFEGKAEDLAEKTDSEAKFLDALTEAGATDEQLAKARDIFRKTHRAAYDEVQKNAQLAQKWAVIDAIDQGFITGRADLLEAAAGLPKAEVDMLKKHLEDSRDPAQSYVNQEVKRRFVESGLQEEVLPIFMNNFLRATRGMPPDVVEEKLKKADEMLVKEKAKKGWIWDYKIPAFLIPPGFKYSPDLDAFTDGEEKWVPPKEWIH